MSELAYIHGKPEAKQRGANVPKARAVDYSRMTEGEMKLFLLREQTDILRNYYSDNPTYQKAYDMLTDSLAAGIHGAAAVGMPTMFIENELQKIVKAIRSAKRLTAPAGRLVVNDKRKSIGNPLVPVLDCEALHPFEFDPSTFNNQYTYQQQLADINQARAECKAENDWRKLLNEHLEKMAHHPLYSFMSNQQAKNLSQLSEGKPLLHSLAMSNISNLSKISESNLSLWQRNGVMRTNVEKGASPLSPESTIDTLAAKALEESLNGAFLAALPAILQALAGALAAASAFIIGLRQQKQQDYSQFKSTVQGWGTQNYSAGTDDFYFDESGNAANSIEDNLPLLLLAAGGAIMLTK